MSEDRMLRPRLSALLGEPELEALHSAALRVLEEVGLHVADEALLQAVEGHPGITRRGSRLHFAPEFVDEEVSRHRARVPAPKPEDPTTPPTVWVGAHCTHYVDLETDELRPLDWASCVSITRSIDGLYERGLRGSCPGAPSDVAPGLREVAQELIGWEHCRGGGGAPVTSHQSADFIYEMKDIMGVPYSVGIHVVSPLRLEGVEYEIAVRFAARAASVSIGSMPIMGITAPIYPAGAFVIAVAEVLGSWLAVRLFLEREEVYFSFDAYSADPRTGAFIYGNPEQKLIDLIKRDVNAYYHAYKPGRSLYTMARRPGAQSCGEMAMLAVVDALCGQRRFWQVCMAVDEVCSLEQYVLCLEMMGAATRIADGVRWDEQALAVDTIRDVLAQGLTASFLTHETTLEHYKEIYWLPQLWDRRPLAAGEWGALEPARERAKQIAREAAERSDFALPEDKLCALREVYKSAEDAFRG